jgi:hypothetical protein
VEIGGAVRYHWCIMSENEDTSSAIVGDQVITGTYVVDGEVRTYSVLIEGLRINEVGRILAPGPKVVPPPGFAIEPRGSRRLGIGAREKRNR